MKELAAIEIVIVKLIVVSLILFGAIWAFKFVLKNAPFRRAVKARLDRIIPLLEGIIWLGFMLWCIGQLIQNDLWNSIGVLVILLFVVVLLFWFVLRDYLAGIVLKTDGSMKLNDWIRIKDIEGKITDLGLRTMKVTTDSGETVNIPYSTLSGEISAKPNPSETLISHNFEIEIPRNSPVESTITNIRSIILNAPWASVNRLPEIKLINDTSDHYLFEITIYAIRMVYFQKIKEYLNAALAENRLK